MLRRRLAVTTGAIGVAVLIAGTALWAAEVTGVTVSPTTLTIQEGSSSTYSVAITSIAGNISAHPPNAPEMTYCSEWTIHSDASITCDQHLTIPLQRGRNYSQNPLTAADVAALTRLATVNVDSGLCGASFVLEDSLTLPSGSGADFGGGALSISRSVTVNVTCTSNPFGGCGHGYWKNHVNAWPAQYSGNPALGSVFTMGSTYSTIAASTFTQALIFNGGSTVVDKAKLLLLQAVAALLNAAQPLVNYPLTQADIISQVNTALASGNGAQILALKDTLAGYNNLGSAFCPDVP